MQQQNNKLNKPNKLPPAPRLLQAGKEILTTLVFYLSILIFIIGFKISDTPLNGWYQQFMPSIGNRSITDITFLDSLNGYAIANVTGDTNYVMKTTNRGDNWQITYRNYLAMTRLQFLNLNTGFVCGGHLYKTIDGGFNWTELNTPAVTVEEMFALNDSTIWFVNSNSLVGGVYRTTNGGASWDRQLDLGSQNPSKIYMYNARVGFVSSTAGLYKTTNGTNWSNISNDFSFSDMFFIDSLTGWKASGFMKKTTNGGINWNNQTIPTGGNILGSGALEFMNRNNDTIWAIGESVITGGSPNTRGILFRTINSGNNWLFQLPDTSIHITRYFNGQFISNKIGWAYSLSPTGVHTTTGGNDTFYTSVNQNSEKLPVEFKLYNNYPNPFNPITKIKFQIKSSAELKLAVYDVTGKQLVVLADKEYKAGTYEVTFDGTNYSSGIYFYSLIVDGKLIDTKKMILIK